MRGVRNRLAGVALLAALLAGCGPHGTYGPIPNLRLQGTVRLRAVDRLPPGVGISAIRALAGYLAIDGTPRLLFDRGDDVYDIGADGTGLRLVPNPGLAHCTSGVAALDHGRWASCPGGPGIVLTSLGTPGAGEPNQIPITMSGLYFAAPAWSPDSREVALLTHADVGCALVVYAVSATFDTLHAIARLDLPLFVDTGCQLAALSWSPDGAWLAFVDEGTVGPYALYVLNLARLSPALPPATAPSAAPVVETVPDALLAQLGRTLVFTPPSWSYAAGVLALTFVSGDPSEILRVDPATDRQTRLLALPEGIEVTMLAWTPDNRHLAFVVGPPACGDCLQYASQLYIYTPPGG